MWHERLCVESRERLGAQIPSRIEKVALEQAASPDFPPADIQSTAAVKISEMASAAIAAGVIADEVPPLVAACFVALKSGDFRFK